MQNTSCGKFSVLLQSKFDSSINFARVACGCWKCPKCTKKRLKPAWVTHLSGVMQSQSIVYRTVVPVKQWQAVAKHIRRAGGNYARIRKGDGMVVYSSVPLNGSERLCRHDAAAICTRDINSIEAGIGVRRPISTSRRWKMPKPDASRSRRCVLRGTPTVGI